ncbi:MAG TPA: PEPxxWA-CTERM sorting domain-containing protein [Candidatus Paceibacterota bacterium]|nr:PEPxxWA-CTERM sorting domain-containing protein [Candidatus Paceibacterota bacterium]
MKISLAAAAAALALAASPASAVEYFHVTLTGFADNAIPSFVPSDSNAFTFDLVFDPAVNRTTDDDNDTVAVSVTDNPFVSAELDITGIGTFDFTSSAQALGLFRPDGILTFTTSCSGCAFTISALQPSLDSLDQVLGPVAATGGGNLIVGDDIDVNFRVTGYHGRPFVATAPVPEPATWGLMILGFGFTGAALRARRRLAYA